MNADSSRFRSLLRAIDPTKSVTVPADGKTADFETAHPKRWAAFFLSGPGR